MKRKIAAFCLVIMCVLISITSCSSSGKFLKYLEEDYSGNSSVLTSQQITAVTGDLILSERNLAIFVDMSIADTAAKYYVYNIETNTVLYTYSVPAGDSTYLEFEIFGNGGCTSYAVKFMSAETGGIMTKAELYQEKALIASLSGNQPVYGVDDIVVFGYSAYSVMEGLLTKEFDIPDYFELPDCDFVNENYKYLINDDGSVTVFDRKYNILNIYSPSACDDFKIFILEDGNILCQKITVLPQDAKKYTVYDVPEKMGFEVYDDGIKQKVDLSCEIFNPKNGKSENKNVDFVIGILAPGQALRTELGNLFGDKLTNLAQIAEIKDGVVSEYSQLVVLNNHLKVKAELSALLENAESIERLGNEGYLVTDKNGNVRIVDNKGKKIADFVSDSGVLYNEKYIIGLRKLYDFKMNLVFDFSASGYEVHDITSKSVILYKDTGGLKKEYAIFNGTFSVLISADSNSELTVIENGYFVTKTPVESGYQYKYYNDAGNVVATFDTEAEVILFNESAGYALLKVNGAYFRLSK